MRKTQSGRAARAGQRGRGGGYPSGGLIARGRAMAPSQQSPDSSQATRVPHILHALQSSSPSDQNLGRPDDARRRRCTTTIDRGASQATGRGDPGDDMPERRIEPAVRRCSLGQRQGGRSRDESDYAGTGAPERRRSRHAGAGGAPRCWLKLKSTGAIERMDGWYRQD